MHYQSTQNICSKKFSDKLQFTQQMPWWLGLLGCNFSHSVDQCVGFRSLAVWPYHYFSPYCNLADTIEQTGGYNFSIKWKKYIPACQTRYSTFHFTQQMAAIKFFWESKFLSALSQQIYFWKISGKLVLTRTKLRIQSRGRWKEKNLPNHLDLLTGTMEFNDVNIFMDLVRDDLGVW